MPDEMQEVIREFNDRGVLWLLDTPANLKAFVQIVSAEIAEHLDFSRAERINRSFIPDDLQKQETDLLYRVPFRQRKGEVLLYLLIEHQSLPDPIMGLRFYSYMDDIWGMERRAWEQQPKPRPPLELYLVIPILFYTGKRPWKTPVTLESLMPIPAELHDFVPQYKTLFLSLRDITPADLTKTGTALAWALRALKSAEDPLKALSAVVAEVVANLNRLPDVEKAEWLKAMRYVLLLIRHKRKFAEQDGLYQVVYAAVDERRRTEVETMFVSGADKLLQEGRQEGERLLLLRMMRFKFGSLSDEVTAKVNALTEPQIDEIATRIFEAKTLDDLKLPS